MIWILGLSICCLGLFRIFKKSFLIYKRPKYLVLGRVLSLRFREKVRQILEIGKAQSRGLVTLKVSIYQSLPKFQKKYKNLAKFYSIEFLRSMDNKYPDSI